MSNIYAAMGQERHEEYMKRRLREEARDDIVSHTNRQLTYELEELKNRIKTLETDIAYLTK
jgi:hypothetical protein